ncbi:MAG: hypothetical protein AAF481_10315 [Acidobacteriota bacterium]
MLRTALAVLVFALLACGGGTGERETGAATTAPPATNTAQSPPLIDPLATPARNPSAGGNATAGTLAFDLPKTWTRETPRSAMRQLQASIPGPGGPAEIALFHFPGQGGSTEANLERWIGQMELAPGTSPQRETFESSGLRITTLEVAGTLLPSGMGTGPTSPQPNSRMLAAVVEGPGGPWFFKATGPDATLAAEREAFGQLLGSLRLD